MSIATGSSLIKSNGDNALTGQNLSPAKRGSKKGWVNITGQAAPTVGDAFLRIVAARSLRMTDAVHEAVALYVDRYAEFDPGDRRAGDDRRAA